MSLYKQFYSDENSLSNRKEKRKTNKLSEEYFFYFSWIFFLMASIDTDVTMVPAGEGSSGAGPSSSTASTSSSAKKYKRFEIKKWNAVALWAWGKTLNLTLTLLYKPLLCLFFFYSLVNSL